MFCISFQNLRAEARVRLTQLDGLTQRSRTLFGLFRGAMGARLIEMMKDCGQRWDQLSNTVETVCRRLKVCKDPQAAQRCYRLTLWCCWGKIIIYIKGVFFIYLFILLLFFFLLYRNGTVLCKVFHLLLENALKKNYEHYYKRLNSDCKYYCIWNECQANFIYWKSLFMYYNAPPTNLIDFFLFIFFRSTSNLFQFIALISFIHILHNYTLYVKCILSTINLEQDSCSKFETNV